MCFLLLVRLLRIGSNGGSRRRIGGNSINVFVSLVVMVDVIFNVLSFVINVLFVCKVVFYSNCVFCLFFIIDKFCVFVILDLGIDDFIGVILLINLISSLSLFFIDF